MFQSITYLFWSPLFVSWPHCPRWTPSASSSAASGWSSASSPCPAPPCCPASSPPPPPVLGPVCSGGCYPRLVAASGWRLWTLACVETCCCCSLLPAVNLGTKFSVFRRNELIKICYGWRNNKKNEKMKVQKPILNLCLARVRVSLSSGCQASSLSSLSFSQVSCSWVFFSEICLCPFLFASDQNFATKPWPPNSSSLQLYTSTPLPPADLVFGVWWPSTFAR